MRRNQQSKAKQTITAIAQVRAELQRLELTEPTNDFRRIELLKLVDMLKADALDILTEVLNNPENKERV